MAQSKAEKNAKARQKYYQKEYKRLITQAKKMYNSMNIGTVLGPDTPSFEKILNYVGTSSGLKRPNKGTLKKLRRLQSEGQILWGLEKTINKKNKTALHKVQEMKERWAESEEAVFKAEQNVKKSYKKQLKTLSRKEQKQVLHDIIGPIEALLAQLREYRNYCNNHLNNLNRKKHLSLNEQDRIRRLETALNCDLDIKGKIESILSSADTRYIMKLSENVSEFYDQTGGLTIEELYEDGPRIRPKVFFVLDSVVGNLEEGSENEPDLPIEIEGEGDLPFEIGNESPTASGSDISIFEVLGEQPDTPYELE